MKAFNGEPGIATGLMKGAVMHHRDNPTSMMSPTSLIVSTMRKLRPEWAEVEHAQEAFKLLGIPRELGSLLDVIQEATELEELEEHAPLTARFFHQILPGADLTLVPTRVSEWILGKISQRGSDEMSALVERARLLLNKHLAGEDIPDSEWFDMRECVPANLDYEVGRAVQSAAMMLTQPDALADTARWAAASISRSEGFWEELVETLLSSLRQERPTKPVKPDSTASTPQNLTAKGGKGKKIPVEYGGGEIGLVLDLATEKIVRFDSSSCPEWDLDEDTPQALLGADRFYQSLSGASGALNVPEAPLRWEIGSLRGDHTTPRIHRGDNLGKRGEDEPEKYLVVLLDRGESGLEDEVVAVQVDGATVVLRRGELDRDDDGTYKVPDWVSEWILGEDFPAEGKKISLQDGPDSEVEAWIDRFGHGYGRHGRRRLLELLCWPELHSGGTWWQTEDSLEPQTMFQQILGLRADKSGLWRWVHGIRRPIDPMPEDGDLQEWVRGLNSRAFWCQGAVIAQDGRVGTPDGKSTVISPADVLALLRGGTENAHLLSNLLEEEE